MRTNARRIRALLESRTLPRPLFYVLVGPVLGAITMIVLEAVALRGPLVPADEVLLGRSAQEISNFVAVRFASEIRHIGLGLLEIALVMGAALGTVSLVLLLVRRLTRGPAPHRPGRTLLLSLFFIASMHAGALVASMSRWPQLYAPAFYASGPPLSWLEIFVTDYLTPRSALLVTGILLSIPFLLPGPTARVRRLVVPFVLIAAPTVVLLTARESSPHSSALASAPPSVSHPKKPNILILAADGLRADRLRPEVAPHLFSVASRGTTFDRAYVSLPRTLSSWTTLLTGQYAHHHGLRSSFPTWDDLQAPRDTLPKRLRDAGYVTAAASDYAGDVFQKTDYGFSINEAPHWDFAGLLWQRGIQRSTPLLPFLQTRFARSRLPEIQDMGVAADPSFVAEDALRILDEVGDRPFFLVVFFSTTHFPYAAPAPYFSKFTNPAYRGPYRYEKQMTAGIPLMPSEEDVTQIRGLYDGAVSAVDDASARILSALARTGHSEDTIVVVTSDHGETLFEHDRWHGHGDHLFGDEAVHVPLAIYDPRTPTPHHEGAVVSNVDFTPTLCELAGVSVPLKVDGRSLAAALTGAPLDPGLAFAETELWMGANPGLPENLRVPPPPLFNLLEVDTSHGTMVVVKKDALRPNLMARHRMARDARFKLLFMPNPRGVEWRLFDTAKDPEETQDVKDEFPDETARLRQALVTWMSGDPLWNESGGQGIAPRRP